VDFEFRLPITGYEYRSNNSKICDGLLVRRGDENEISYAMDDTDRRINTYHNCFSKGLEKFEPLVDESKCVQNLVKFDIRQFLDLFHYSDLAILKTTGTPLVNAAILSLSAFCHNLGTLIERRIEHYKSALEYAFGSTTLSTVLRALGEGKNYAAVYSKIASHLYKSSAYTHIPDYLYVIKRGINLCMRASHIHAPFYKDLGTVGYLFFDKNKNVCPECKKNNIKIDGGDDATKLECKQETGNCKCTPITSGSYGSMINFLSTKEGHKVLLSSLGLLPRDWTIENIGDFLFIRNRNKLSHAAHVCEIDTRRINLQISQSNTTADVFVPAVNYYDPSESMVDSVIRSLSFNGSKFCPQLPPVINTDSDVKFSAYYTGEVVPYYNVECTTGNGSICYTALQIPKDDNSPARYYNEVLLRYCISITG
jgi:hypothetical protein